MRRPLFFLLIALIAGIISGSLIAVSYYLLLSVLTLILFLFFVTIRNQWSTIGFFLIIIFIFVLGVFDIQKQKYFVNHNNDISRYIDKGKMTVEGIVIESPLSYTDKNVLIVRCLRTMKDKSYIPISGNIRLAVPALTHFQYGDFIRFHSTVKRINNFNNPGRFDYQYYLNLQGIYATGFVVDTSGIVLLRHNSANPIRLKLESFRLYLKKIIYNNADSPRREIIEAMTIGNQNAIPSDVRDSFNKTGTAHILSISGLHIGMVAATAFFFVLLILKTSQYLMLRFNIIKLAAAAAFLMVSTYAFIAGMGVTVLRSTLMALIFLIALISGKQKDLYNTLALAGLLILIISPEAVFDISFQLSFMAVLALIYIVPRFSDPSFTQHTFLPLWGQQIVRHIYLAIIVCCAATIGTLPLIMYYFNRVSSVTIIANLICVPLLGTWALAISMFFILSAFFSPVMAGYFIKLASLLVQISVDIINALASLPWSSFNTTKPNLIEIAVFYLFVILVIQFIDARKKRKNPKEFSPRRFLLLKYLLMIMVVFLVADIFYLTGKDKLSADLKMTVIDVGQGNSILLRFPGGENMLVDGGGFSESTFDTGKAVVAPFLCHERIGHIDTAVLSHPHPDHLLGLIYIMNNFHVQQVWKSVLPVDSEAFPEWNKVIKLNNIHVSLVSNHGYEPQTELQGSCLSPDRIVQITNSAAPRFRNLSFNNHSPEKMFNGVRIDVLWPPNYSISELNNLSYDEVNDSSLVLKITFGKIGFLIPGDISADVEKQLIKSGVDLRSDVLIVPHHGSDYSSSAEFIKAVACRYAIVSAGKANVFHHPHPSTIQRYDDAGVHIFRTDRDGAVTLMTDGIDLHIDSFIKNR